MNWRDFDGCDGCGPTHLVGRMDWQERDRSTSIFLPVQVGQSSEDGTPVASVIRLPADDDGQTPEARTQSPNTVEV